MHKLEKRNLSFQVCNLSKSHRTSSQATQPLLKLHNRPIVKNLSSNSGTPLEVIQSLLSSEHTTSLNKISPMGYTAININTNIKNYTNKYTKGILGKLSKTF